jgi:hypothetical protein
LENCPVVVRQGLRTRQREPTPLRCPKCGDTYQQGTVKSASTFLSRWRGAHVLVRELSVSIRHLQIVLFRSDDELRTSNLVLAVVDPLWMCGPFRWSSAALMVHQVEAANTPAAPHTRDAIILEIVDEPVGFRLLNETLEVFENKKL